MNVYEILILCGVPSIISTVVLCLGRYITKKKKEGFDEGKAIREGLQALLRDRLMQGYRFYVNRGYCRLDEKSTYSALYEAYHSKLNLPNGVMKECFEEVMALPPNERGEEK